MSGKLGKPRRVGVRVFAHINNQLYEALTIQANRRRTSIETQIIVAIEEWLKK